MLSLLCLGWCGRSLAQHDRAVALIYTAAVLFLLDLDSRPVRASTCRPPAVSSAEWLCWQGQCLPYSSHHYREPKGGEAAHIFSLYVYCTNPVMSFASCRLTDDYGSVSCSAYPLNTSCSSQLHWFVEASAADQQNQCQCSVTVTSGSSQYRAQKTCLDKAIGKNASIIAVVENQIVTAIPTAKFTIRLDKTESGTLVKACHKSRTKGLSSNTSFSGHNKFVSRAGQPTCAEFYLDLTPAMAYNISTDLVKVFKDGHITSSRLLQVSVSSSNSWLYNITVCTTMTSQALKNGTYQLVVYNTNQCNRGPVEKTLIHAFDVFILKAQMEAPTTKTTTVGPTIMTSPPSHPATVTSDVVSRQTTSRTVPPVTTGVLYPTLSPTHTTGTTSTSDALGKTPGDITSTTLTYVIVGSLVFVLFVCVIVFVCYLRMTCLKISGTVPAKVKRQHNLCAGNANNQGVVPYSTASLSSSHTIVSTLTLDSSTQSMSSLQATTPAGYTGTPSNTPLPSAGKHTNSRFSRGRKSKIKLQSSRDNNYSCSTGKSSASITSTALPPVPETSPSLSEGVYAEIKDDKPDPHVLTRPMKLSLSTNDVSRISPASPPAQTSVQSPEEYMDMGKRMADHEAPSYRNTDVAASKQKPSHPASNTRHRGMRSACSDGRLFIGQHQKISNAGGTHGTASAQEEVRDGGHTQVACKPEQLPGRKRHMSAPDRGSLHLPDAEYRNIIPSIVVTPSDKDGGVKVLEGMS